LYFGIDWILIKNLVMTPLNTGIIGFGLSGKTFQAPFLHLSPKFCISKICSSRRSEINILYPDVRVVRNVEEIHDDPLIELVIVASPNALHYSHAKAALENDKHVVVEKPFVLKYEEGEELIKMAREKQKVLAVFQNRRWDGDFMTVAQIVDSDILGRITDYDAHFDRYRPQVDLNKWGEQDLPGSGVLYNLGPHLIDQAIALFGMPRALFADVWTSRDSTTVDDTFELILFYEKMRARLKAAVLVKELGPHFIVHGTKGSFVKYGMDPQEAMLKKGIVPDGVHWGVDDENFYGILNVQKEEKEIKKRIKTEKGNYMHFFDNLYTAIIKKAKLAIVPEIALENIRIINSAFESVQQKKIITL
jgi:predicted dehydrogenase